MLKLKHKWISVYDFCAGIKGRSKNPFSTFSFFVLTFASGVAEWVLKPAKRGIINLKKRGKRFKISKFVWAIPLSRPCFIEHYHADPSCVFWWRIMARRRIQNKFRCCNRNKIDGKTNVPQKRRKCCKANDIFIIIELVLL